MRDLRRRLASVGATVGLDDGALVGTPDGSLVGCCVVGTPDGSLVGCCVGALVGTRDGADVEHPDETSTDTLYQTPAAGLA